MRIVCLLAYYNRPRLAQCSVLSVLSQTHRDLELLVLDDDSSLPLWLPEDERIVSLQLPPSDRIRGPGRLSAVLNAGLESLRARYAESHGVAVCYLADDDWYHPMWFERLSLFFNQNTDVDVAYGQLFYSKLDAGFTCRMEGLRRRFPLEWTTPAQQLDHNQVAHRLSCLKGWVKPWTEDDDAISAKVRQRTGQPSRGPDAAFFAELYERTGEWKAIAEPAAFKRVHDFHIIGTSPGEPVGEKREW